MLEGSQTGYMEGRSVRLRRKSLLLITLQLAVLGKVRIPVRRFVQGVHRRGLDSAWGVVTASTAAECWGEAPHATSRCRCMLFTLNRFCRASASQGLTHVGRPESPWKRRSSEYTRHVFASGCVHGQLINQSQTHAGCRVTEQRKGRDFARDGRATTQGGGMTMVLMDVTWPSGVSTSAFMIDERGDAPAAGISRQVRPTGSLTRALSSK